MSRCRVLNRPVLPLRDGVSPSRVWLPASPQPSLTAWLAQRFPEVSEATWQDRLARGLLLDADGRPLPPDAAYRPDSPLYYYRELTEASQALTPVTILYADDYLLVVDKPHFMTVMPAGRYLHDTVLVQLRRGGQYPDLAPLHRLDRDTAGVLMFSVDPATRDAYARLFRERRIEKVYHAVADPAPTSDFPQVRRTRIDRASDFFRRAEVDGQPNAETRIDLLAVAGRDALYEIRPHTGQTHQIRVHMAAIGLPLRYDRLYPQCQPLSRDDPDRPLQLLARALHFTDPVSKQPRQFVSRLSLQFPEPGAIAT